MSAYDTALDDLMTKPSGESFEVRAARRIARWEHWLPQLSKAQLSLIGVLCAIFVLTSLFPLHHTDLWGHLAYGRHIVENGTLPTVDPLGEAAAGETFTNVSWLAQAAGYQLWKHAGPGGLQLAHVLLVTLAIGAVILAIRVQRVALGWAVAGGAIAYLLAMPISGVIRPQLFGMIGLPLTLVALSLLPTRRLPLLWLPLMFKLWCNVHGSFVLGFVVIGCYLASGVLAAAKQQGLSSIWKEMVVRRTALLLALSVAATGLNPQGFGLLFSVLTFGNHSNLQSIVEWHPTVLASLTGGLFFGSLLVTGILIRTSRRRFSIYEVLLLITFAVATLLAMRMLTWWAIIWPVVMTPHLAAVFGGVSANATSRLPLRSKTEITPLVGDRTAMNTLIAVAIVFVALVVSPVGDAVVTGQERAEAMVVSDETPVILADTIDRLEITGKIFAPMKWADYLLWHADGSVSPLVFSHVHRITSNTWQDYQRLGQGAEGWAAVIARHQLTHLVLDHEDNHRLILRLREQADAYRVVHRDQRGLIVEVLPPTATELQPGEQHVKKSEHATGMASPSVKVTKHSEPTATLPARSSNKS